jgi:ferrous iron transport protein B
VLGTLGVIYNLGDVDPGEEEGGSALVRRLRAATWDGTDRPVFTLPVALSIMVFFALCAQCASTLVIIGRETGSWVWPVVVFVYMTVLAWIGAWLVYQAGTALGW